MKFLKYCFSIIIAYHISLDGINRNQLPNPQLNSANIEWWFPTNLPPKLHITLRYFEIGDIWKGFAHKTPEEKRKIRKEYSKLKDDLIKAKNTLLNTQEFSKLFKTELADDEKYTLKGIDIISTHPDFYNHYVLNTSSINPSGTQKNLAKFKKIFEHGDPFETESIKTRHGRQIVPKYHWHLVGKLESNIISFRNKLCLSPLFNQFPETNKSGYLPHITLGRIKNIKGIDKFLSAIQDTNIRLSNESIERKSFKLKDIERFHPNEHKIYLLLDKARKSNMIFMLVIGWKTSLGKLLKNVVKLFPEEETVLRKESVENLPAPITFEDLSKLKPIGLIY